MEEQIPVDDLGSFEMFERDRVLHITTLAGHDIREGERLVVRCGASHTLRPNGSAERVIHPSAWRSIRAVELMGWRPENGDPVSWAGGNGGLGPPVTEARLRSMQRSASTYIDRRLASMRHLVKMAAAISVMTFFMLAGLLWPPVSIAGVVALLLAARWFRLSEQYASAADDEVSRIIATAGMTVCYEPEGDDE